MEGAQDAQAVLGGGRPRLQLELVQAQAAKFSAKDVAGCGGQLALLLLAGALAQWVPKWAFIALALLVLLVARLLGWLRLPVASRQQVGRLLVFPDQLVLQTDQQTLSYPLDAATRIQLRYQGYQHESLGGRQFATGIHNFIQVDDGPEYAFNVPSEGMQVALHQELRRWYERRVRLKEYRRGNRTVLLTANLSDEQVQQYQREFGIRLYRQV